MIFGSCVMLREYCQLNGYYIKFTKEYRFHINIVKITKETMIGIVSSTNTDYPL